MRASGLDPDDAPEAWDPGTDAVLTEAYRLLRVCARFGYSLEYVDALTPERVAALLAFDHAERVFERRERVELASVGLAGGMLV